MRLDLWANKILHCMYLSSWRLCVLFCFVLLSCCCDPFLRLSHPSRHDSALAAGWGKERAWLDDQNTLKDDHNKVTCTPLLPCLVVSYHTSECLTGGGGCCILGGSYTDFHFLYRGYRHPTLSLSTSWAPLGSHMVSRDGRGLHSQGFRGQGPHNCGPSFRGYLCPGLY